MSKLIINNVELELDLLDADVLEKYEALNQKIKTGIADMSRYEGMSNADAMREQCRLIGAFFDDLFGPGTANVLFGTRNHLGDRMEAFGQVAQYAGNSNQEIRAISERYTPKRQTGPQDFRGHGKGKNKNYYNNSRARYN